MATCDGREVKRVGGEFQDSDKNNHIEKLVSEQNCCDHKQAGKVSEGTAEESKPLFTHMDCGGTLLSREDRMNALLKLKGSEATNG